MGGRVSSTAVHPTLFWTTFHAAAAKDHAISHTSTAAVSYSTCTDRHCIALPLCCNTPTAFWTAVLRPAAAAQPKGRMPSPLVGSSRRGSRQW